MTDFLYYTIIYPIELLIEIVFSILERISTNPGIAIIGVSIIINLLLLPLYNRADAIQSEERKKQDQMLKWKNHIKKTFKGDERFMMLQMYYYEQDYHPIYSLRSSISLMLQIPFFIAAYHFLSNLDLLNGVSFLGIPDLGKADGLISIGTLSLNFLPILMTAVNCVSSIVFTWKPESGGILKSIKDNTQLYILAAVFLILLYPSPSGLVLYWTMNNVFSLFKNIIMRNKLSDTEIKRKNADDRDNSKNKIYCATVVLITVLIGLLIPSALIAASPTEFVEPAAYRNPLSFVFSTFCISMGTFLIWLTVFYYLSTDLMKKIICFVLWLLCSIATIDYFLFNGNFGNITNDLEFETVPVFTVKQIAVYCIVLILVIVICTVIMKKTWFVPVICSLLAVCFVVMSGVNIIRIESKIAEEDYSSRSEKSDVIFPISKQGKNVVVIMLDRAISAYVPYIFSEKPELKEKYDGFVYYPNTISFGMHTNYGAPALFGGYEYTPKAMNERSSDTLKQKHDEALGVMPVIFSELGYETTVCDPPYAGYEEWPDLSIYDSYPAIHAHHTGNEFIDPEYYMQVEKRRRRSFFMYSIFKISPMPFQPLIYDEAQYLTAEKVEYLPYVFERAYSTLSNFTTMTEIWDNDRNTYMTINNLLPHDPCELQLPDYETSLTVNNAGLEPGYRTDDAGHRIAIDSQYHYHANMKALMLLAEWFDYLRANGVYDNTRIIIVADHGRYLGDFPEMIMDDNTDMEGANPLFMFKDFDAKGFKTSDEFMTNADTPILAMKDIVSDPVNPFTGVPLNDSEKTAHDQYITSSNNASLTGTNNAEATIFDTSDAPWYSVHDNIFERSNWKAVP